MATQKSRKKIFRKRVKRATLSRLMRQIPDARRADTQEKKVIGIPFKKGNKFGRRFQPGKSGNPSGRPKFAEVHKSYRNWLAADITADELRRHKLPKDLLGLTHAQALAWIRGELALTGSLSDAVEMADRSEGRAATSVNVIGGEDPMISILNELSQVRIHLYGEMEGKTKKTKGEITSGNTNNSEVAGDAGRIDYEDAGAS